MFYVSYIEEYPIYEPAEGGYYYAGESVRMCRAFHDWEKANRFYQKLKLWFLDEYSYDSSRLVVRDYGGCGKYVNPCVCYRGKYIGEGARIQITRKEPVEKGWVPYH